MAHNIFQKLDTFHKTRLGYLVFGVIELGLVVLFASLALSTGDWWEYILAAIFTIGFLQNFGRAMIVSKT